MHIRYWLTGDFMNKFILIFCHFNVKHTYIHTWNKKWVQLDHLLLNLSVLSEIRNLIGISNWPTFNSEFTNGFLLTNILNELNLPEVSVLIIFNKLKYAFFLRLTNEVLKSPLYYRLSEPINFESLSVIKPIF